MARVAPAFSLRTAHREPEPFQPGSYFRQRLARLGVALVALSVAFDARASAPETFGIGSRSSALGAAQVAWGFDAFGAYGNPASVGMTGKKKMLIGAGFVWMHPQFDPITDVVVENSFTGDQAIGAPRIGDVDTDYRDTAGFSLGGTYRVSQSLGVGFAVFMPLLQVAFIDSGDTYNPEYILYRARTQRPALHLAGSWFASPYFSLGAGLSVGFATTAAGFVFLNTSANTTSTMRMTASVKPRVAPYLGFLVGPNLQRTSAASGPLRPAGDFTIGGNVRFPLDAPATIRVEGGARALGPLAGLDVSYTADSSLYYDPWSIELGGSVQLTGSTRLLGQVDYQVWSLFTPSTLIINEPATDSTTPGIVVRPTTPPDATYRNIIVPRVGVEQAILNAVLRAGYAYRPSILNDLPTGNGNYLDPSKHILTAGVGFTFQRFLAFEIPCRIDLHGSVQVLTRQSIDKATGDETGNPAGFRIGAPGYEAGGLLYGGGASLTLAI